MKYILPILLFCLTSCMRHHEQIDFQEILESAQNRADQDKSLSEDSLLCQALEYYRTLEPKDSIHLLQSIRLTALHEWWKGEKKQAYELLHSIADTDKQALHTLFFLTSKDYDFEASYQYLCRIMEEEEEKNFWNQQALAVLSYYMNQPDECEYLFDNITQYIQTPEDSMIYWRRVLPNHADIVSDYGNQEKAIKLQMRVLNHSIEKKDSANIAIAHASLARYYLLQDNLKEAEIQLHLSKENINEAFRNNIAMSSYMVLLQSIFNYAKNKHINIMNWANFVNSLQENANNKQKITDAKEEVKRLLNEQNLKLTIEKQRTQLITTYIGFTSILIILGLTTYIKKRKHQIEEKEEELDALRKLVNESQQHTELIDDRFFKRIMLQQLGIIRMAAANPTTANQEFLKRMSEIVDGEIPVNALLNWEDLYRTIDYIYTNYYTHLKSKYGELLNEKEIQLCCLLKANFSTKEISIVTQQGIRTVYQRKTVIRQKLGIEEKGDIAEYLSTLSKKEPL